MKLLWLTDLHLRAASEPGHEAAAARFSAVLGHALAHHPDAERLIITGDIANTAEESQYRRFAALNANSPLTLRLVPGNHDNPENLRQLLSPRDWPTGGLAMDEVLDDYHLFFLDSHAPGRNSGHLGAEQLAWLDQRLPQAEKPALLFLHHQPGPVFLPSSDRLGLEDKDEFRAVLVRHRSRIAHIFFGHCHRPISGTVAGLPMTGLPAVANQMLANFATPAFIPDPLAPPCYGVILGDGDTLASHLIWVDQA